MRPSDGEGENELLCQSEKVKNPYLIMKLHNFYRKDVDIIGKKINLNSVKAKCRRFILYTYTSTIGIWFILWFITFFAFSHRCAVAKKAHVCLILKNNINCNLFLQKNKEFFICIIWHNIKTKINYQIIKRIN